MRYLHITRAVCAPDDLSGSLIESGGGRKMRLPPHRGNRWCMPVSAEPLKLLIVMLFVFPLRRLVSRRLLLALLFFGLLALLLRLREAIPKHAIVPNEGVFQLRLGC